MTDDDSDLEPIDLSRPPQATTSPYAATSPYVPTSPYATTAPPTWVAGWYADPWTAGQYRYWNGQTWTGETNRWGPSTATVGASGDATDPWPSAAGVAGGYGWPGRPAATTTSPAPSSRHRGPIVAGIVALVVVLVASAAVGYAINANSHSDTDSAIQVTPPTTNPATNPTSPGPTSPPGRVATPDPDEQALSALGVQQSDVNPARTVVLIPNGNQLSEATLDLCNGDYPTEALRTARMQVADIDSKGNASLSTEAVLYKNAETTAQAFAELRKVSAACPHQPVTSPVGDGTEETEFHAAPDANWSLTPGVERQAYSLTTTAAGQSSASIAVYLRRGRALIGVYFPQPKGAQPVVAGQRSIEGIVDVFASRLAKLPASVVN
jgi:Protein of unknown function (DUF2510)